MNFITIVATATLLVQATQEPSLWSHEGDWYVLREPPPSNLCYTARSYPDLTVLRIGYLNGAWPMYIGVGNPGWSHIQEAADYYVVYSTETQMAWPFLAKGNLFNPLVPFLLGGFDSQVFLADLMSKNRLTVRIEGQKPFTLSLKGSKKALEAMAECQRQTLQPLEQPKRQYHF